MTRELGENLARVESAGRERLEALAALEEETLARYREAGRDAAATAGRSVERLSDRLPRIPASFLAK